MGCPSEIYLGQTFSFSITTHDPDTGIVTDADAVPTYRIYEHITEAAILNGNVDSGSGAGQSEFDDGNTVGLYAKEIAGTSGNGFEINKTYHIYVSATVDGDTGTIAYTFQVNPITMAIMAKLSASASTIAQGTVSWDNTNASTTVFYSDDITEATADHFNGRIVIFTSGDSQYQATDITDYELDTGEGRFTVSALAEAPADNITFVII